VHTINQERKYKPIRLGNSLEENQRFQAVVPAGDWFGAALESNDPNDFALVGCTVAPGFDFRDFEMPSRRHLLKLFPEHKEVIELLTKN
jgi:predicted cupin superfamily sugar epimerase